MSLSGHFKSKWVKQDKLGREIKAHEDYRTARIRHADGSHAEYRAGKMVPGSHVEASKKTPKKDVASGESKFYKPTEVSTIVVKQKNGETDTAGESETTSRVRKRIDVNARAMKL
jgi:hypothetical protein